MRQDDEGWFLRNIPSRFWGLIQQYYADRDRRMEAHAQRREIARKKKAAEDAAAIRAFQQKGKKP